MSPREPVKLLTFLGLRGWATPLVFLSNENVNDEFMLHERIKQLKEDLTKNQKNLTTIEYNKRRAVYEYLVRLDSSDGKIKASNEAACVVCISPKQYLSQKIHFLAEFYLYYKSFPITQYGQHQKYHQLIDDEDIALQYKKWICKELEANRISPTGFMQYVNDYILPECIGGFQKKICLQTVKRWLDILGCKCREYKKRMYFDGHELEDVVAYRSVFLDRLRTLEQRIATYKGESMIKVLPILNEREQELVFVTHDECIFYSNDRKKRIWVHDVEMPLQKKGNGRSIIVSEFLTEECGQLKLTDRKVEMYPDVLAEARCYFMPRCPYHIKNEFRTWENQPVMRSTTFFDSDENKKIQQIVFGENYEDPTMRGKLKGLRLVLKERRLWKKELHLECK
ncbi:21008_t:CDS:2, partial [Cetraspora pellucida]